MIRVIQLTAALLLTGCSDPAVPGPAVPDPPQLGEVTLVQKVAIGAISITPGARFPVTPRAGNLLVAVLGTLHDYPLAVPDGWTPRILPDTPGFPLAVYERIADGAPTDIAFTLTSNDATTVALFEFTGPAVSDAHAQNSTGRRLSDASTSVSTGTAENTTGTIAIAVIHRPDEKAERVETIDDWTNGFVEIVDFGCGLRSRTAVAIRAVSAGPVETSASWTTPRQARGAIVTYANALP